ncbi:MAG: Na+:solute symporter, partial [Thermoanaerobaculia bacterium]|nr:Na+:solute symporter [Thermoanaerobaculia bacterium]
GLAALVRHPEVAARLDLVPDLGDPAAFVPLFLVPVAVQWWASWYPGAEPGGGGYVAQRMLAARSEGDAVGATLLFNVAHYALRPWPWIVVALASVVVFPDLESLARAFPAVDPQVVRDDLAYPAMLTFLPRGLLGLVVASLVAAFMSTISTHLNWGSSYVTHDFYRRFLRPEAGPRELVLVGRLSTVALMVLAALVALELENALQAFQILLQIGAGTGLLFLLRWFWWRINAWSELAAMTVSFLVAVALQIGSDLPAWKELLIGVAVTTVCWVGVTLLTPPSDPETLRSFCRLTRAGGPGWRRVTGGAASGGDPWPVPLGIACMLAGCGAVYAALFATGNLIYGRTLSALLLAAAAVACGLLLVRLWRRLAVVQGGREPDGRGAAATESHPNDPRSPR